MPPTFFHRAKYPNPHIATPPIPRLLSVAAVTSHAPASARHVVFQVRYDGCLIEAMTHRIMAFSCRVSLPFSLSSVIISSNFSLFKTFD